MVFVFVQNFFFGQHQHKSYNIFFYVAQSANFFSQNLTIGYMTNTLNHINFFFLNQNQNIFLEKKHTPPPFKLNGRSLRTFFSHNFCFLQHFFLFFNLSLFHIVKIFSRFL